MRILLFLVLTLVVVWTAIGLVLAPVVPGGAGAVVMMALLATPVPLAALLLARSRGRYPGRWFRLLALRPFWYLQLLILLCGPGAGLGLLLGTVLGDPRRGALVGLGVTIGLFALAALAGYAGTKRLAVRRLELACPGLPAGLDGLRIVQLSDLHVGPHTSRRFLRRIRETAERERGELLVVTGDLVDDHAPDVADYAAVFGDLDAPLGVYAVPGNHDIYAGWPAVRERLERLPLTVLVNDWRLLSRGGTSFALAGTGDPAGGRGGTERGGPELARALAGIPPDTYTIALAHNPLLWPPLAEAGVGLTLSGHTHWGQFAIPTLGWSLASPFLEHAMGVHTKGDAVLFIHPGTNYWGIPFRLGTPPEVATITLRAAPGGERTEGG